MELMVVVLIIGILASVALPKIFEAIEKARIAAAITGIQGMHRTLEAYRASSGGELPLAWSDMGIGPIPRDPWGQSFYYHNFSNIPPGMRRKDGPLVPINSEYDIFSAGKDGGWTPTIQSANSQDDVFFANDGGFIGLPEDY